MKNKILKACGLLAAAGLVYCKKNNIRISPRRRKNAGQKPIVVKARVVSEYSYTNNYKYLTYRKPYSIIKVQKKERDFYDGYN